MTSANEYRWGELTYSIADVLVEGAPDLERCRRQLQSLIEAKCCLRLRKLPYGEDLRRTWTAAAEAGLEGIEEEEEGPGTGVWATGLRVCALDPGVKVFLSGILTSG
jgi:hypothetical protein